MRAVFGLTALLLGACSSSSADAPATGAATQTCVSAPACPDAGAPSYQSEILPILREACIPCHSPSGTAGYDETSYAQVHSQFGAMLSQVAICAMPPLNGPQLSDAQRIALTAWLKCSAPDN